ncbi:MAG: amino acid ABC transporter substrate-binding protein [Candidatus Planktophila sp.]|jgi:polar amino acid transport system substrate-binding protein|nr:amino acid ABC transporter substrate-binding protein [Candidatus Planktophila sp.]
MKNRKGLVIALTVAFAFGISACSSSDSTESASASCEKADLATVESGVLTIATGEPAYYPWVIDDAPESGEGFEAAVAYAVATQLGFSKDEVKWVRTTFDSAVTPGEKNFDFNLQQFSITEERKAAVDFSSPYYTAPQAIVSFKGSKIDGKSSIADLKDAKLGAAVGTTSLDAIESQLGLKPSVFNDNAAGVSALKNKQIDGLVVDLPTAFYLSGVEVENGIIVGQLPSTGSGDQFGLLLTKGSALTSCVSGAVDAITADGTLTSITDTWLATNTGSPVLKP